MTTTEQAIVESLGGARTLRREISSSDELREQVRAGLPFSSLESLGDRFDLGREDLSAALHLPLRTIARRKRERRLRADESDRLVRLARVLSHTATVFGDPSRASLWLHRENRALGGARPLDLLDTDIGARQVEDVLGRIEHGIPS